VDLFEYQARDLFESHQIPVLAGAVATTADQAFSAAEKIGGKVVVKAQVKVGGRGKAGGVKVAENAADAKDKAGAILGMDIKGHIVKKVMIARLKKEVSDLKAELSLLKGGEQRDNLTAEDIERCNVMVNNFIKSDDPSQTLILPDRLMIN